MQTAWRKLKVSLAVLLSLWASFASALPDIDISAWGDGTVALTSHLEVLEDPAGELTFADVVDSGDFTIVDVRGDALGFSYTSSAIWLRTRLVNTAPHPVRRIMEINYALLANADVFLPQANGDVRRISAGYAQSRSPELLPSRFIAFAVDVPSDDRQWIYLRVQTPNSLNVPARLWTPDAYWEHLARDMSMQALYFGLVLSIGLYNLVLFLSLRDINYLLYVIFAGFVALSLANFTGMGPMLIWGQAPYWSKVGVNIPAALATIAMLLFAQRMLETATCAPVLHRMLHMFTGINVGFFLLLWGWFEVVNPAFVTLNMLTSVLILLTGVRCMVLGQRSAYFFVAAFSVLFVANALTHLRNLGVLPTNLLTSDGLQIGSALEMLLLSLVLADRFHSLRREAMQAQERALIAQQQLVRSLQSSERQLESKVAERTAALQEANSRLEQLSTTDPLTQLANRRQFESVYDEEWRRARRLQQSLAVGMIDVDWFKAYNDRYGHRAGDDCLRQVAMALSPRFNRGGEMVARYGGEEFVFIASATDSAQALALAEGVRETIEALELLHEDSPLGRLSVSVGVASLVPGEAHDSGELIERADRALYAAKSRGRNRVVSSPA